MITTFKKEELPFALFELLAIGLQDIEKYSCLPFKLTDEHFVSILTDENQIGFVIWSGDETRIHLYKIYVKPGERGKGYAKGLVKYLQNQTKRLTFTVHKNNESSLELFKDASIYGYCMELTDNLSEL